MRWLWDGETENWWENCWEEMRSSHLPSLISSYPPWDEELDDDGLWDDDDGKLWDGDCDCWFSSDDGKMVGCEKDLARDDGGDKICCWLLLLESWDEIIPSPITDDETKKIRW